MSLPHFEFPDSPVIAGDAHDDDAAVIDNLVEQSAEPPTPDKEPKERITEPLIKPKPITRLFGQTLVVDKAWTQPTMIIPANPRRKALRVTVVSGTSTDVVRVSDEKNGAQGVSAVVVPAANIGGLELTPHTGAVWVLAPDTNTAQTVTVIIAAVSE